MRGQGWHNQITGPANHDLEAAHVSGLYFNFACQFSSNVGGLKSHVSQAPYSINHGLEAVYVSGLKFACRLTSNVGGLAQAYHVSGFKIACQLTSNVGCLEQAEFVKEAQFTFAQEFNSNTSRSFDTTNLKR